MAPEFELNSLQMDAIREIGNIGTGNAATALSKMLGKMVDMDVPQADLVPIYEISTHYGTPETPVCAVLIRSDEEFLCNLIFLIDQRSADDLANILINMDLSFMDEEARTAMLDSAVAEVGNIILGAFLNALAQVTGWCLPGSPPAVAKDMLGSIMDVVAASFGIMGETALLVKTNLRVCEVGNSLQGAIVMVPDPGSLDSLLAKLGVL